MANEPARPSAQQLFDEALSRFAANKQKPLVDTGPDLMRVQALAAAVQAEQLTRVADSLDRLERAFDSTLTVGPSGATFVRTWPGRT